MNLLRTAKVVNNIFRATRKVLAVLALLCYVKLSIWSPMDVCELEHIRRPTHRTKTKGGGRNKKMTFYSMCCCHRLRQTRKNNENSSSQIEWKQREFRVWTWRRANANAITVFNERWLLVKRWQRTSSWMVLERLLKQRKSEGKKASERRKKLWPERLSFTTAFALAVDSGQFHFTTFTNCAKRHFSVKTSVVIQAGDDARENILFAGIFSLFIFVSFD